MELIDELADAYLQRSYELQNVLNINTGEIFLDGDEGITGEPGLNWDDEEADDLYIIPQISSSEGFDVMHQFTLEQDRDVSNKLLNVLNQNKSFRRFKDKVIQLNLEEQWYKYEKKAAEKAVLGWLGEIGQSYQDLNKKYLSHNDPF
ncbi:hypothetical protein JOC86_004243 [Bacillus pakistanensis]|uniref:Uncharacterized protein n=1 Tax=Rossellomorea pakistanensis TaxID=992288 RepID=A0ABS2NIL1_9BACI|nr:UPF0158 family protein [Bacillus pakistanensis]MBM7587669.1 hypothetical protein [Bacillus pakistanensis]